MLVSLVLVVWKIPHGGEVSCTGPGHPRVCVHSRQILYCATRAAPSGVDIQAQMENT